MKLGVLSHKIPSKEFVGANDVREYLGSVESAASLIRGGLILGPDYALLDGVGVNSFNSWESIQENLLGLSRKFPDIAFVPGTCPVNANDSEMVLVAPVIINGSGVFFNKQTDHGEGRLAKKFGLRYKRGESKSNTFQFQGKKCWLQICGDRNRKPESRCSDADLELISSHDKNAGFHIGINTPRNPRYILLSDSFHPMTGILNYSVGSQQFLKTENLYEFNKKTKFKVFDIK